MTFTSADALGEQTKIYTNSIYGLGLGQWTTTATGVGSFINLHHSEGIQLRADAGIYYFSQYFTTTDGTPEIRLTSGNAFNPGGVGNYLGFKLPAGYSADQTYTLPVLDGSAGQVLSTDGSGVMSWADAGSGGSVASVNGQTGVVSLGIQEMDDFALSASDDGGYVQFSGNQVREEVIYGGLPGWVDGDFYISAGSDTKDPAFAWNASDSRNGTLQTLQVGDVIAFDFDTSQTYNVTEVGGGFLDELYFRFDAAWPYAFANPSQSQDGSRTLRSIRCASLRSD